MLWVAPQQTGPQGGPQGQSGSKAIYTNTFTTEAENMKTGETK